MITQQASRREFIKRSAAGLGGLLVGAGGCRYKGRTTHPNVVVLVLDTVRQDHLSCYGYERGTSPFLDVLTKSARVYHNAYSTSCWTVPAHASLFTGLYPVCHGAHWEHLKLDEELGTLAEVLRAHGYQTIGLSENPLISTRAKFAQGFDTFVHSRRRGQDTNVQFKEALEQKGEKALFVFVNLMAAHAPYNSSAQFFKTFLSDPAYGNAFHADLLSYLIRGKDRLGAKWLAHLTEHYDAEVRYDDFLVQQMVQALESTGLWDSTLFIVTSDHGENLGEHDLLDHQFCLYEMLVRVPLIIHYPERFPPASHDYRFVQLTDVFPTVLRIVGIDPKEYPSHGRSLLPGETARDRVMLFEYYLHQGFTERHDEGLGKGRDWGKKFSHPRVQRFSRRLQAVRAGNMKFIRGDDGVEELYDLREDPREERNLITEEAFADVGKRLERMINERLSMYASLREPRAGEPVKLDEEDIRQLKALGYI